MCRLDMRALGVDFGTVRVGLAVSDDLGVLATPLPFLKRSDSIRKDAQAVAETAEEENVQQVVVGLPLTLDGGRSRSTELAEEFGRRIGRYTKIPVIFFDERFSSSEAEERLMQAGLDSRKARQKMDSQAAAVLLESYLRSRKSRDQEQQDAS